MTIKKKKPATIKMRPQDAAFIIRYNKDGTYGFEFMLPGRKPEEIVPTMELACCAAFIRIVKEQDMKFVEKVINHFAEKPKK